jgi:SPP1 gp7 family putative phage head morphogenesis protein
MVQQTKIQEQLHETGQKPDPFSIANSVDSELNDVLAPRAMRGIQNTQTMTPTAPIPNLVPTAESEQLHHRVPNRNNFDGKYSKAKTSLKKKVEQIGETNTTTSLLTMPVYLDEWLGFQSAPIYAFVQAFLKKHDFKQVESTITQKRKLKTIFLEAFYSGMNLSQLAGEIEAIGFERTRSDNIARTETIRIANEAKLLQAESKEYSNVIFTATKDNSTCEKCKKLDGKKMSIKKAKGIIPIHGRCRCSWRVLVE